MMCHHPVARSSRTVAFFHAISYPRWKLESCSIEEQRVTYRYRRSASSEDRASRLASAVESGLIPACSTDLAKRCQVQVLCLRGGL
jgi:hypothetical protein